MAVSDAGHGALSTTVSYTHLDVYKRQASSNRWDIVIKGVGGHAAQPHASVDPIIVAADMVHALSLIHI